MVWRTWVHICIPEIKAVELFERFKTDNRIERQFVYQKEDVFALSKSSILRNRFSNI